MKLTLFGWIQGMNEAMSEWEGLWQMNFNRMINQPEVVLGLRVGADVWKGGHSSRLPWGSSGSGW